MAHTELIGRYRVIGTLGQGAMGRVYLAYDPGFGIQVAVKLIKRDSMMENQVILSRFKREAALGARMRHPNIVAIYDVGHDVRHGPYMVMEYVDGQELLEILETGRPTRAQLLDWLCQIARALQCSHRVGVIHRDVKPANVLVAKDGKAKLIDFGVAKVMGGALPLRPGEEAVDLSDEILADHHATAWGLLSVGQAKVHDEVHIDVLGTHRSGPSAPSDPDPEPEGRPSDGLTRMGALIGTPAYTAPELLRGEPPGPVTDQFAFCVMAFQMLLGRLPFRGADTLVRIKAGNVDFPSSIDPRLREVFRRALAVESAERHIDLDAFLDDLHQACGLPRVEAEPAPAPAPRPGPRAQLREELLRWARLLGGGVAALVVAGALLQWWLSRDQGLDEISVSTLPPGASVYVDGQYLGQSPVDRVTLQRKGGYLRILKKGYEAVERRLTPRDGYVSLVLERSPYDLSVESEPAGAEVFLDGRPMGTTPALLRRIPGQGEHVLELRHPGHLTARIPLDPARPPKGPVILAPNP